MSCAECTISAHLQVALLAEGVDRNSESVLATPPNFSVALLAEGVDRNTRMMNSGQQNTLSPSSRRAWIEMWKRLKCFCSI